MDPFGEVGVTTSSLTKGQTGARNGDTDYCNNPLFPCGAGEGDCDVDAHCSAGMVCGADLGELYGMNWSIDVCVLPHCLNGVQDGGETGIDCGGPDCAGCTSCPSVNQNGNSDFCSYRCPCGEGQGDCDDDSQCLGALICGNDNGAKYGFDWSIDVCVMPHCANGIKDADETGTDCGGADCTACVICPDVSANGTSDFCSAECPCAVGQGDCDNSAECGTGLVCGNDNGAKYGLNWSIDVCVVPHCTNGTQDADETGVDCGGADCTACVICPSTTENGTSSFCSAECPCAAGQGDCDSDSQCTSGLVCGNDNGDNFGLNWSVDACVIARCANGAMDGDETGIDCGGADCGICP